MWTNWMFPSAATGENASEMPLLKQYTVGVASGALDLQGDSQWCKDSKAAWKGILKTHLKGGTFEGLLLEIRHLMIRARVAYENHTIPGAINLWK